MKKILSLAAVLIITFSFCLLADQFKLKNGQIISAKSVKYSEETFYVKDSTGQVIKIPLKNLTSIIFEEEFEKRITISELKLKKEKMVGQTVTLQGQYLGWTNIKEAPPVTRSDWVLKDDTGTIYVTGRLPKLDPFKDRGQQVEVSGIVEITPGGRIYLKSQSVLIYK